MKRTRLGKEDWLDLALSVLSADGPEALRIEALCRKASVTKGSFYHHFADMDAFLGDLGHYWIKRQTLDLMDDFSFDDLSAEAIAQVVDASQKIDLSLELHIRDLARRHPGIAEVVAKADEMRLAFLAAQYARRFGVSDTEARDLSMLDFACFLGCRILNPAMARDEQIRIYTYFEDILRLGIASRHAPAEEGAK
ncbi:MAG: TetR/AcrR family transcriptional regulator [Pseudomonadota bacterium]